MDRDDPSAESLFLSFDMVPREGILAYFWDEIDREKKKGEGGELTRSSAVEKDEDHILGLLRRHEMGPFKVLLFHFFFLSFILNLFPLPNYTI